MPQITEFPINTKNIAGTVVQVNDAIAKKHDHPEPLALQADLIATRNIADLAAIKAATAGERAELGIAMADARLLPSNIIAGSNVSVSTSGNNVTISSTGGGGGGDSGYFEFFIPDVIYASVGEPIEIYAHQVLFSLNSADFEVYLYSTVGNIYNRKWSYTPKATDGPTQTLSARVYNKSNVQIYKKDVVIKISEPMTAAQVPKLKVMLAGDSLSTMVTAKYFLPAIRELSRKFVGSETDVITLVGTSGTAPDSYESVGGAQIKHMLINDSHNPFWDAATNRTNFAAYTARTGIKPDILHLLVGTNDARNITGDEPTAQLLTIVNNMQTLLEIIRTDWPDVRIFLGLTPYVASRDASEFPNAHRQFKVNSNIQKFCKNVYDRIKSVFGETDMIVPIPYIVTMDKDYGYGLTQIPANPFIDQADPLYKITVPKEFVHPLDAGQRQNASELISTWAYYVRQYVPPTPEISVTNMLSNPTFNTLTGWSVMTTDFTGSYADGIATQTGKPAGTSGTVKSFYQDAVPYIAGHKYYFRTKTKINMGDDPTFSQRRIMTGTSTPIIVTDTTHTTDWVTLSVISIADSGYTRFQVQNGFTTARIWDGYVVQHTEPMIIDLTAAGIEDWTKERLDAIPFFSGTILI